MNNQEPEFEIVSGVDNALKHFSIIVLISMIITTISLWVYAQLNTPPKVEKKEIVNKTQGTKGKIAPWNK